MKNTIPFLLFFALYYNAIGQSKQIQQLDLIGCWKYYPEESKFFPDIIVYRPCDYESFSSKRNIRGRFKINFSANGKCSYLKIGAIDINVMKPGKWILNSSTNELEIFDLQMNSIRKYKIIRLEKSLLGIKKN